VVQQPLSTAQRHYLDEVRRRRVVQAPSTPTRVDIRTEADLGDNARLARGDGMVEARDLSLRKVVGLDLPRSRKIEQPGCDAPEATHDAAEQSGLGEVLESGPWPSPGGTREHHRQAPRPARSPVPLSQRPQKNLRCTGPTKASDAERSPVGYAPHDGVCVTEYGHRLPPLPSSDQVLSKRPTTL
jgi:hypothetical protein